MNISKWFKFNPKKELLVVLLSWVMVVSVFYLAFNIITIQRVALHFITFAVVGITILGITVPVAWNTLIMQRPLSDLGIKKDKLGLSITLCIIFSVIQYYLTIRNIETPSIWELAPLITMTVAVGFYENIFYRGWIQLRMEEYFGIIPGILLSAIIYCLYHIGYGMTAGEMVILFIVGLVYSSIFRLTTNVFILFPFLTPSGAFFTQLKEGLRIPFEATYGFACIIVLCIIALVIVNKIRKGKEIKTKESFIRSDTVK